MSAYADQNHAPDFMYVQLRLENKSNRKGMENETGKNKFTDYHKLQSGLHVSPDIRIAGGLYQPEQCQENDIDGRLEAAVFFQYLNGI